jgi:polysaccharide biosynthesis protein PslH
MKVLVFSSTYPLPENTGSRMRTMNFVRFFRKHGSVDIVYKVRDSSEESASDGLFGKACRLPSRPGDRDGDDGRVPLQEFGKRLKRLLERRPYILAEWSPKAIRELTSMIIEEDYDIVLCRYIFDSRPLFELPGKYRARVIIDFDDIFSDSLFAEYVKSRPGIYADLKKSIQKRFITSYQRKCLNFGAGLFCSTYDESRVMSGRGAGRTFVVPNTYPDAMNLPSIGEDGYEKRHILLFVGSLEYGPNISGVKWFIETIFPEVRGRHGGVRMKIVGRRPSEEIRKLCSGRADIDLHADVDDVKPFYDESGVVVVPVISGGGTRIKILEAAMAGRPVLSTPVGAYGLECTHGADIMIFEDKESFLEGYERLGERGVYENCVRNLKTVVQNRYTPAAFERAMEDVTASIR